jgi:hypothetical protein
MWMPVGLMENADLVGADVGAATVEALAGDPIMSESAADRPGSPRPILPGSDSKTNRKLKFAEVNRVGESQDWEIAGVPGSRVGATSLTIAGGARSSGLINQASVAPWPDSPYRKMSLKKFLDSVCLIHMGEPWKRKDLVKNYANRYGSVHLDWSDDNRAYRFIAESGPGIAVSNKRAIDFELLTIIQILCNSVDAIEFCEAAGDRFGGELDLI